jgi:hypothetical protein
MRPLFDQRHRDGEELAARDLAADVANEDARRALHVRAVHGTWGVALGFDVQPDDATHALAVGPGFGYDCRGRAIVSPQQVLVPIPSLDETSDLVVSASCGIRFCWRQPDRACDDDLVLVRAHFKGGRTTGLDTSVRHCCRARRFRLAAGVAETRLKERIAVSTDAGSFASVPYFFATLEMGVQLTATVEIDSEKTSGFRVVLRAPADQLHDALSANVDVRVHWVGVEPLPRCGTEQEESR